MNQKCHKTKWKVQVERVRCSFWSFLTADFWEERKSHAALTKSVSNINTHQIYRERSAKTDKNTKISPSTGTIGKKTSTDPTSEHCLVVSSWWWKFLDGGSWPCLTSTARLVFLGDPSLLGLCALFHPMKTMCDNSTSQWGSFLPAWIRTERWTLPCENYSFHT